MKRTLWLAGIICIAAIEAGAVPRVLNFQGRITEAGSPVNGSREVIFRIYPSQTGVSALFTETRTVALSSGIFNVLIGETTPGGIPVAVFDGNDRYVEVQVGAAILPRQRMASVGHAFYAERAKSLDEGATVIFTTITVTNIQVATLTVANIVGSSAALTGSMRILGGLSVGEGTIHVGGGGGGIANAVTITQAGTALPPQIRTAAIGQQATLAPTGATALTINSGAGGILSLNPQSAGGITIGNAAMGASSNISMDAGAGDIISSSDLTFTGAAPVVQASAGPLVLQSNGVLSLNPASGGNVGIGTTAPAQKLSVAGTIESLAGGYKFPDGSIQTTAASNNSGWTKIGAVVALTNELDNAVVQSTLTVRGNGFSIGGSTLTVAGGRVGVGTATPDSKLHISGVLDGSVPQIKLSGLPANNTSGGGLVLGDAGNNEYAALRQLHTSPTVGLAFEGWNGSALGTRMVINGAGNVGIGTTSPASKLEINGDVRVTRAQGTNDLIIAPQSSGEPHYWFKLGGTNGFGIRSNGALELGPGGLNSAGGLINIGNGSSSKIQRGTNLFIDFGGGSFGQQLTLQSDMPDHPSGPVAMAFNQNTPLAVAGSRLFEFQEAGNPVMSIDHAGNVGIGTTAPVQKLSVAGAIESLAGGYKFPDGSIQTTAASGGGETNTFTSSKTFTAAVGLATKSGNVGVGTAAPARQLHLFRSLGNPALRIETDQPGQASLIEIGKTGALWQIGTTGVVQNDFFITDGADRFYIHSGGNVGIGTHVPASRLDVEGSARFGSGVNKSLFNAAGALTFPAGYSPTAPQDAATKGYVDGQITGNLANSTFTVYSVVATSATFSDKVRVMGELKVGEGTITMGSPATTIPGQNRIRFSPPPGANQGGTLDTASPGGAMPLHLNADNTGIIRLNPDSTGGVGVGLQSSGAAALTDPVSRLHVRNQDAAAAAVTNLLTLDHGVTGAAVGANGIGAGFLFRSEDAAGVLENAARIDGLLSNAADTAEDGALAFLTRAAGGPLMERIRISPTGNLGIGTTSPGARLDVAGNIKIVDGTQGAGKVLTSDANGFANWQDPAGGGGPWTKTESVVALTNSADNVVVQTTLTVNGNEFSVGGSLFAVAGGNVGIGTLTPATRLDVNGSAQFGFGVTKSTFTASGSLLLADNANLALSGSAGTIISASSVTASGLFGAGLTAGIAQVNSLTPNQFVKTDANKRLVSQEKVSLDTDVKDNLGVNKLNFGAGATSTSFWRGDGTWAAITAETVVANQNIAGSGPFSFVVSPGKFYTLLIRASHALADATYSIRFNGDETANYKFVNRRFNMETGSVTSDIASPSGIPNTSLPLSCRSPICPLVSAGGFLAGQVHFTTKPGDDTIVIVDSIQTAYLGTSHGENIQGRGYYDGGNALSTVSLNISGGSVAGTIILKESMVP